MTFVARPRSAPLAGVLVLALGAALSSTGCGGGPKPPADAPARRVILLTCDTLRADRLGFHGWPRPTSPELDRLARQATVFDDAWSASSITGPSLSSLHTGHLPDEIGVATNSYPLAPEAVTLAERARDAGYATAAVVSNYVLRRPPSSLGDAGLAQGFQHFDDRMDEPEPNRPQLFERSAEPTTDAALAWLAERRARAEDRFFLWVHYQDPHGPYTPPEELLARFPAEPSASEPELPLGRGASGKGAIPRYQALGELRRPADYRARYEAEVHAFDRALGRLLRWLEEAGWLEDALLVFTADHGESLGEDDYWFCHGETLRAELVRVPLVVRFPAGAGGPRAESKDGYRRVATPVQHLDLWPTILWALGLDPGPSRGLSLAAPELPAERDLVQTLREAGSPLRWVALKRGPLRLARAANGTTLLHDHAVDPRERRDLSASAGALAHDLSERLDRLVRSQRSVAPFLSWPISARERAALRGLGYTGEDEEEAEEEHGH